MNNNQEKVNELNMDYQTYKKISGTLNPKDKSNVTITSDKPKPTYGSTSTSTSMTTEDIEPQDQATIKYLSNVKDANTGEISKPFTIADKRYQMVRGQHPTDGVIMAVYCLDDVDAEGNNVIHPMEYFEETIAKPMKDQNISSQVTDGYDYAGEERAFHDRESFMDYLNLVGLEGYKHFFVNIKTGEIKAKFKSTKEMAKSGIKLGPDEDYMDIKSLKRFRFGDYFKSNINEAEPVDPTNPNGDTNIPKLQADVAKLVDQIKKRFSVYLSKLDKPIEQAEFLTTMAQEIGVPLSKLSTIITQFRDIAVDTQAIPPTTFATENKIITKKELEESVSAKKVIKTIKIKDIK